MTRSSDAEFSRTIHRLPEHWRNHFLRLAENSDANPRQLLTLRHVLLSLRDMPYARPVHGNTAQACVAEWTGTCSAKHLAAQEWLALMGYRAQFWMASYVMDFHQPYFSDALRTSAAGIPVYDVHNFLTCDLGRGEIVIDITFPPPLGRYGFPVTTEWDGESDFKLCCSPLERIAIEHPESAGDRKRDWLQVLNPPPARQLREAAILEMSRYALSQGLHLQ